MWVCHINRWTWDTGGRAPNVGMPHQQMGMTLVGGPLMWVCHISRWAWDTGGKAPNMGMPHQQMGMGHWWEGP